MLAVRRGGVDSVRQLVASMFLMETQVIINTISMMIKMHQSVAFYDITLRPPVVSYFVHNKLVK